MVGIFPLSLWSRDGIVSGGFQIRKHVLKCCHFLNNIIKWVCVFFLLKDSMIKTVQGGVLVKIRMHTAVLVAVVIQEGSLVSSVIVEVDQGEGE